MWQGCNSVSTGPISRTGKGACTSYSLSSVVGLEGSSQEAILLPHTTFDIFSVAFRSAYSTVDRPFWTYPCFHACGVGFEVPHQPPIRIKAS
jgi:hypothetical protein